MGNRFLRGLMCYLGCVRWLCRPFRGHARSHRYFTLEGVIPVGAGLPAKGPGGCVEKGQEEPPAPADRLFAGSVALAPRDAQALAAFPQALAADPELASQLGFGHVVLVFEHLSLIHI